jgi:hypothetical protein
MSRGVLAAVNVNNAFCEVEISPTEAANLDATTRCIDGDYRRAESRDPLVLARRHFKQTRLVFDSQRLANYRPILGQVVDFVGNQVPALCSLQHPAENVNLHVHGPT